MREAAVIGQPISHSLSPEIFSFLAEREGMRDFRYSAREVAPSELSGFLREIRRNLLFIGCNVTIPHKEKILKELDGSSDTLFPEARAVGAVNVLRFEQGRIHGHNTDVAGVSRTLEEARCAVRGARAMIWGAGGAARAAAFALGKLGARRVSLLNRDRGRAQALAERMRPFFPETEYSAAGEPSAASSLSLVINATPVGMMGGPFTPDFFSDMRKLSFSEGAVAFDMIYRPGWTDFLQAGQSLGLRPVGGLEMLIHQALVTWETWFGALSNPTEAKSALSTRLRAMFQAAASDERPVFLTGFMGVGKSTVAAVLAKRLDWALIDTDRLIEEEAGLSVAELFKRKGEAFFRQLEKSIVAQVVFQPRSVVALGGGALMDSESFKTVERAGHLVFLDARPDTLRQRLAASAGTRPLLAGVSPERQLDLLNQRKSVYLRAKTRIDTDQLAPEEIALKIASQIGRNS